MAGKVSYSNYTPTCNDSARLSQLMKFVRGKALKAEREAEKLRTRKEHRQARDLEAEAHHLFEVAGWLDDCQNALDAEAANGNP